MKRQLASVIAATLLATGVARAQSDDLFGDADGPDGAATPMTDEELQAARGGLNVDGAAYDFGAALFTPASTTAMEASGGAVSSLVASLRTTITRQVFAQNVDDREPASTGTATFTVGGQTVEVPAQSVVDASAFGDAAIAIDNTLDDVRIVHTVTVDIFLDEAAMAAATGAAAARSVVELDFVRALSN